MEKDYEFFAIRENGELIDNPDLREIPLSEMGELFFLTPNWSLHFMSDKGLWIVNDQEIPRLMMNQYNYLGLDPLSMRQFKKARSYFLGSERLDVLREFHLEARIYEDAERKLDVAWIYSFETEAPMLEVKLIGEWFEELEITLGRRTLHLDRAKPDQVLRIPLLDD